MVEVRADDQDRDQNVLRIREQNSSQHGRHSPASVARSTPSLTQDQRLAWIHQLLTGSSEALPYRIAGILLLLYAQPLVRVVALRNSDVVYSDS